MSQASFEEKLYASYHQSFKIDRVLYEGKSLEQEILVFSHEIFGNVLALDGIIQTTEKDEFIYHEMMVHPALILHPNPKKVLVVGGGDGGSIREALKHPAVESVTLVEIDQAVIDFSKQYLPHHSAGAFSHPKLRLVIQDALEFIGTTKESFDVIINDATDPVGPGVNLYKREFYKNCLRALGEEGILIGHNGVFHMQKDSALETVEKLREVFPKVDFFYATIPTYCGGEMLFHFCSRQDYDPKLPLQAAAKKKQIEALELNYLTPSMLARLFAIPRFIEKELFPS